ncbi:MAG: hypothetical protein ACRDYY_08415 [Acidimicrobiales bacterium]
MSFAAGNVHGAWADRPSSAAFEAGVVSVRSGLADLAGHHREAAAALSEYAGAWASGESALAAKVCAAKLAKVADDAKATALDKFLQLMGGPGTVLETLGVLTSVGAGPDAWNKLRQIGRDPGVTFDGDGVRSQGDAQGGASGEPGVAPAAAHPAGPLALAVPRTGEVVIAGVASQFAAKWVRAHWQDICSWTDDNRHTIASAYHAVAHAASGALHEGEKPDGGSPQDGERLASDLNPFSW